MVFEYVYPINVSRPAEAAEDLRHALLPLFLPEAFGGKRNRGQYIIQSFHARLAFLVAFMEMYVKLFARV